MKPPAAPRRLLPARALAAVRRAVVPLTHPVATFAESLSAAGLGVASAALAASTQPSIAPRRWHAQAAISGGALLAGYAVGRGAERLVLTLAPGARLNERSYRLLQSIAGATLGAVAVSATYTGASGQRDLARLWHRKQEPIRVGRTAAAALGLFAGALQAHRSFRRYRLALRTTLREAGMPDPMARTFTDVAYLTGTFLTARAVLMTGLRYGLGPMFLKKQAAPAPGIDRPTQPERSGSPESPVDWETIGFEGSKFAGRGPTPEEISALTGKPAREPIRLYAPLPPGTIEGTAEQLAEQARTIVAELDRTNAWDREVLAVVVPTGSGWVDGPASAALEYLHGGDTAIVAIQYSIMPSWVQFLRGLDSPANAGRILFNAIHERWLQLPADSRPKLVPFGLSLGAFGSQSAFSSIEDLTGRAAGAVWAGSPSFTPLHRFVTDHRDPGSPQIRPVIDGGRHVRFATGNGGRQYLEEEGPGQEPRVVYIQHPSDAVTLWWFPAAWHRDDWFSEPRGQDVPRGIRWYPLITGAQLFFDMVAADSGVIPPGFAHHYCLSYVDSWRWVTKPEGWDEPRLAALRDVILTTPR